jgi:hypothetical protein
MGRCDDGLDGQAGILMGSDLYACVEYQVPKTDNWFVVHQTTDIARGPVVDSFGDIYGTRPGHLTGPQWKKMQEHEECPWRLDEPYWVRLIPGEEFACTVRGEPWLAEYSESKLDPTDNPYQAGTHLRAIAAMIESYIKDGISVRVWCWHSQ